MKNLYLLSALLCILLTACGGGDEAPPGDLAITSPASGSPVSGTVAVQVSSGEGELSRVDLYARPKGVDEGGKQVGSAVQGPPFVMSWNTTDVPNSSELDLVAIGKNSGSAESASAPVTVKVQNTSVPTFQLLTAFTIPPDPTVGSASVEALSAGGALANLVTHEVLPPTDLELSQLASAPSASPLIPQAEGDRDHILEWQWEPYTAGAEGYAIYRSDDGITGPYELERNQAATAGAGAQKFSKKVEGASTGSSYHGTVKALSGGTETGYANADKATFLAPQMSVSPTEGATLSGGRPTLTWESNQGTVGYLYYLSDKNPWERDATLLWSNFPQSNSKLSADYPAERDALPSGEYSWWVAGVSFDQNGKADGFTFSDPKSFVVP